MTDDDFDPAPEGEHWGVLSEDGETYRVGEYREGTWHPGSQAQATKERDLLAQQEPSATVVRVTPPEDGPPTYPLGSTAVTDLPNWHAHPECLGLVHGHGEPLLKPKPHTHERMTSWGEAVPVMPGWDQINAATHAITMDHLLSQVGVNSTILDPTPISDYSGTRDTALLLRALDEAERLLSSLGKTLELTSQSRWTITTLTNAATLLRERIKDSYVSFHQGDEAPV